MTNQFNPNKFKTHLDWSFPLRVLPSKVGQAEDSQSNRELCAQRSESLQDWRIYLCGQRYICLDREIFVCTEIRKLSNQDVMGNKRVYIWSSQDLPMLQSRRSWSWKICWKSKDSNRTWMPAMHKFQEFEQGRKIIVSFEDQFDFHKKRVCSPQPQPMVLGSS